MKFRSSFHKICTAFFSSSDSASRDLERIAAREQKHFSYKTLSRATDKFNANRKLGEGGFGPVYRGRLDDGREIAVKRLSQTSKQGKKEFLNEARLLLRVQHRNVVNLLGYCARGEDKLLVYEYVLHESLDKLLFKPGKREELDWKKRYDIILGIAKGLHYLHEDAHSCIIHRDVKASNILLDEKWAPKIADFGMARLFPKDETHVSTGVAGTSGYMAPEYLMNGQLTVKADVFSFGVLILELVSGRKNSSVNMGPDSDNLLGWMIMAAIEALGEKEGSNESAISNYIESSILDLPDDHSTLLSDALEKMKESGQLVFANDNYVKADLDAPPKRGRGRPRKNKAAAPPPPATGSTRSRGRPPKAKDPLTPAPEPKKAASVGRPRGRQPKKAEPAPPVEATSGVKRGRGRPPKVRPVATPPAATVGA